jgi:putative ABC transport system permease protein
MTLRRYRTFPWLEEGWRDLRFAVRSLARMPGFTSIALLVIAVGIGLNTAVFTLVDAVVLKPLTYPDPQALVQLVTTSSQGPIPVASIPEYNIWQQQSNIFQQVAAYDWGSAGMNLTGGDHPEQVLGIHVTSGYFALLGAPVVAGRTFTEAEDSPNGGHICMLSYGLWKRRFGESPRRRLLF